MRIVRGWYATAADLVRPRTVRVKLRWYLLGPPPIPPRECPACPHQKVDHSGWGCDLCDCRVNIIDLIPLPLWEVPFR